MHGRSLELCCLSRVRQEGAGLCSGQAGASLLGARATMRSAGSGGGDRGNGLHLPLLSRRHCKAASPSPQPEALLATARRSCLKSHQPVIVPGVTLEMSMARWQGFKQSSACLSWSPNFLLFTRSKNEVCFPRAENPACRRRQVFPNCFPCDGYLWFT